MFSEQKRYAVLGLARSGVAAAYKIRDLGGKAFLSDIKARQNIANADTLEKDFECEFGGHTDRLFGCDEWIVSPGIPLNSQIIQTGKARQINMISELEFGFQIKHPSSFLIAVTGSNGKSTTASLIAHIIKQAGRSCILAGNIGDAFCGFPIEKPGIDYIVLEVSSFQLDLTESFKPDIALLLNVTPDHLNRYDSFEDYARSKFRIFHLQEHTDHAILNADDHISKELESRVNAQMHHFSLRRNDNTDLLSDIWVQDKVIVDDKETCSFPVRDLQIKGPHNWANAMASILAAQIAGFSRSEIDRGLRSFQPLNHRMQFVQSINGISFYNDSKATNTDSVRYALFTFDQPIRIIMGGSDKGEDFSILTPLLKEKAEKVYITGATSAKMQQAWSGEVELSAVEDFSECVRLAFRESQPGDIIVLSPACASYDRFVNFEHRGEAFIQIVKTMAAEYEKTQ